MLTISVFNRQWTTAVTLRDFVNLIINALIDYQYHMMNMTIHSSMKSLKQELIQNDMPIVYIILS